MKKIICFAVYAILVQNTAEAFPPYPTIDDSTRVVPIKFSLAATQLMTVLLQIPRSPRPFSDILYNFLRNHQNTQSTQGFLIHDLRVTILEYLGVTQHGLNFLMSQVHAFFSIDKNGDIKPISTSGPGNIITNILVPVDDLLVKETFKNFNENSIKDYRALIGLGILSILSNLLFLPITYHYDETAFAYFGFIFSIPSLIPIISGLAGYYYYRKSIKTQADAPIRALWWILFPDRYTFDIEIPDIYPGAQ